MELSKPALFKDFIINKHIVDKLKHLNIQNIQNIFLYGKKNVGKKTLLYAFINHLFSIQNTQHIRKLTKTIKNKNCSYTCVYNQCDYYYEIDCLENVKYIKHIINHFIDKLCSNKTINNKFRFIIIHNINCIQKDYLSSLSNLIEKHYIYNKFILISNNCNNNSIFYTKLTHICFNVRCYIKKNEIEKYIISKKFKLSKVCKENVLKCKDLYKMNMIINYKSLPIYNNIDLFIKKIHTLLVKSKNILFTYELKTYIYDLYLLNVNIESLPLYYIIYLTKNKNVSNEHLHFQ